MTPHEDRKFIAQRREAGKRLDPETATVFFTWGFVPDPYGVFNDLSPEEQCICRNYFARSPEEGRISFDDLPDETRKRLEERVKDGEFDDWAFLLFDDATG